MPLPCAVFLQLMGLPLDELELFLELKDGIIRPDASDPQEQIRIRRETGQRSYATFERALEERAHKPGDDLLRFETPVVGLARIVRQDTTLRGVELKAGEPVTLLLGAANADEEEFPGADAVDLGRERNRHLAFGAVRTAAWARTSRDSSCGWPWRNGTAAFPSTPSHPAGSRATAWESGRCSTSPSCSPGGPRPPESRADPSVPGADRTAYNPGHERSIGVRVASSGAQRTEEAERCRIPRRFDPGASTTSPMRRATQRRPTNSTPGSSRCRSCAPRTIARGMASSGTSSSGWGGEALAFFEVHGVGEQPDYRTEISDGLGLPTWVNHIAFRLDTLEELEAMTKGMHSRGIDEILQIDHGWATSIYTTDPNGILVEFCVTTDTEEFAQTEEEALRLMRQPPGEIPEETRKETSIAKRV